MERVLVNGEMMSVDTTLSCLEQQVECYRRLARLAQAQHVHVEQNDNEPLLEVLASRREMVERIASLEGTIGPIRSRWGEYLESIDQPDRERAETLMTEARDLLEKIVTMDRNDMLVLQQRKLNLGLQIQQTRSARQINRSYGSSAYGTGAVDSGRSSMDVQR